MATTEDRTTTREQVPRYAPHALLRTRWSLAPNGGDNQSATVNTNVATAPSVLVTDQDPDGG